MVEDECRLQQFPNIFSRWSMRGNTPFVKLKREVKSVSFYSGLSLKDGTVISSLSKKQNSKESINWLNVVKNKYKGQGKVLIVWDNASWHKSKEIKKWLDKNPGVVELMNFPPYSPDLNPQERVWKEMRRNLAKIIHSYTFEEVVDRACGFLHKNKLNYRFV